jgi:hypothetical protein
VEAAREELRAAMRELFDAPTAMNMFDQRQQAVAAPHATGSSRCGWPTRWRCLGPPRRLAGRLTVMVARTVAFVIVWRMVGLVAWVLRRVPRMWRVPCCDIS